MTESKRADTLLATDLEESFVGIHGKQSPFDLMQGSRNP